MRRLSLLVVLIVGCQSSPQRDSTVRPRTFDGGALEVRDAGDATVVDARAVDTDGGTDATRDAGTTPNRDAGFSNDAGEEPDGGTVDAGTIDGPCCRQTCQTPANCSQNSAPFDADNYRCAAGICEYTGCNSTSECTQVYGAGYVCAAVAGNPIPSCYQGCSTVSDCAQASVLFDADNYRCSSGACEWTGCNNAAECREAFVDQNYTCAPQPGLGFNNCVRLCSNAAECPSANAPPAYDADNYICNASGWCEYGGCNDGAECSASFAMGTWACQ